MNAVTHTYNASNSSPQSVSHGQVNTVTQVIVKELDQKSIDKIVALEALAADLLSTIEIIKIPIKPETQIVERVIETKEIIRDTPSVDVVSLLEERLASINPAIEFQAREIVQVSVELTEFKQMGLAARLKWLFLGA